MSAEETKAAIDETEATLDETKQALVTTNKYPVAAISHMDYPERKLKLAQGEIVERKLKKRAYLEFNVKERKPVLKNVFYDGTEGCVIVECLNTRVHDWICKIVPKMKLSKEGKNLLKVVTPLPTKIYNYFQQKSKNVAGAPKGPVVAISLANYPEEYLTPKQQNHIQRTLRMMVQRLSSDPDSPKPVLNNIYFNRNTGCAMVECANEETSSWLHTVVMPNTKGLAGLPVKVVTEPVSITEIAHISYTVAISCVDYPVERLGPVQASTFENWFRKKAKSSMPQKFGKKPVFQNIFFDSGTGCLMLECADRLTREWVFKMANTGKMPNKTLRWKVVKTEVIGGKSSNQNSADAICDASDILGDNVPQEDLVSQQVRNLERNSNNEPITNKSLNHQKSAIGYSSDISNRTEHMNRNWKTDGFFYGNRNNTGHLLDDGHSLGTSGNSFNRGAFVDPGANQFNSGNLFGRNESSSYDSNLFSRRNNSSDGGNWNNSNNFIRSNWNSSGNSSQSWNRIGNFSGNDGSNRGGNSYNQSGDSFIRGNYSAGGGNWNSGGNTHRNWDGNGNYGNNSYGNHSNRNNAGSSDSASSERNSLNQRNYFAAGGSSSSSFDRGNWSNNRYEASSGDVGYDLFHRRSQDGFSGNRDSGRFYGGEHRSFDSRHNERFY